MNLKELCSSPIASSIAVVDRSADISLAAKSICNALSFSNGASPYAPHVALVNEFLIDDFTTNYKKVASPTAIFAVGDETGRRLEEAKAKQQIQVSKTVSGLVIAHIKDR